MEEGEGAQDGEGEDESAGDLVKEGIEVLEGVVGRAGRGVRLNFERKGLVPMVSLTGLGFVLLPIPVPTHICLGGGEEGLKSGRVRQRWRSG